VSFKYLHRLFKRQSFDRVSTANGTIYFYVTLTLPATAQTLEVQAEGPYGLGNPVANFTETAR